MAGVSEFDARLLMDHAISGVNAGYITRHKLLGDHLRNQQQAVSSIVFNTLGDARSEDQAIRDWLGCGATRRALLHTTAGYEQRALEVCKAKLAAKLHI